MSDESWAAVKDALGVEDIPTHPVKLSCTRCRDSYIELVYFPHVALFCKKCGTQAHVKPMPEGVGYVHGEVEA